MEYPKNVNTDFRKLTKETLLKLAEFDQLSQETLAITIAKRFVAFNINENDVVDNFASKYCRSNAELSKNRKRQRTNREILDSEPARVGEQVAAKALQTNENGSWILANIVSVHDGSYEVQDEDDPTRTVILSYENVRRLEDTASHLRRGDSVLAVFPETTSFYRGVVIKNPKSSNHSGSLWEVIIRFEDDEDETGKAPLRRVPARFVLRKEDVEPEEEDEEEYNE
jgi:hypothetical protein